MQRCAELDQLEENGFALAPSVFMPTQTADMRAALDSAFSSCSDAVRSNGGHVYAARNVLRLWPGAVAVAAQPPLCDLVPAILGPGYGLMRVLFFDKPPERTWALPWHKDLTVAIRSIELLRGGFSKPTVKAGVPHAEAPVEVLERMLTLRIHLDDVTEENGPLKVLPGSHRTGKQLQIDDTPPATILAREGDVLLMRPLLAHASGHSHADTRRHRRILHLEFAGDRELPGGCEWYEFHRI